MKFKLKTHPVLPILLGAIVAGGTSHAALLTTGHADFGVALEDGTDFHFHVHAHEEAVVDGIALADDEEYDADAITINVPLLTKTTVSSDLAAAGVLSGDDIWILPQGNPGSDPIPFLGIATEELLPADWSDITFSLGAVTSPTGNGDFSLWQGDGIGGLDFYFSTADATLTENGDNTLLFLPGAEDHYNWGFTEAGNWLVQLTASGTHDTLGFMSDTQTFQFSVVPEPSAYAALCGLLALALVAVRRRNR